MEGFESTEREDWTLWVRYDPADATSMSERVIRGVATLRDVEPVELPPLYSTLDPEALDSLCDDQRANDCGVTFTYGGSDVYIDPKGDLYIAESDVE